MLVIKTVVFFDDNVVIHVVVFLDWFLRTVTVSQTCRVFLVVQLLVEIIEVVVRLPFLVVVSGRCLFVLIIIDFVVGVFRLRGFVVYCIGVFKTSFRYFVRHLPFILLVLVVLLVGHTVTVSVLFTLFVVDIGKIRIVAHPVFKCGGDVRGLRFLKFVGEIQFFEFVFVVQILLHHFVDGVAVQGAVELCVILDIVHLLQHSHITHYFDRAVGMVMFGLVKGIRIGVVGNEPPRS